MPKWITQWWRRKLSPRYCHSIMCGWIWNWRIRRMCPIDIRFCNNNWIPIMPRRSYSRRKRKLSPTKRSNLMRSWLLEWRKRKLHFSTKTSNPNPSRCPKCMPMPRSNWWIISRNLSIASCHCSYTTLSHWIISNLRRSTSKRIRTSSQS